MPFPCRLHAVLSYRERWTDWHQTPAHMMISSQSPYPTVTRTEIFTLNRSVIFQAHTHDTRAYGGALNLNFKARSQKNASSYTSNIFFQSTSSICGPKHKARLQLVKYDQSYYLKINTSRLSQ